MFGAILLMNTLKNTGAVRQINRSRYFSTALSPAERNTMPAIKKVLDLNDILKFVVIFPLDNRYFILYYYPNHFTAFKEIQ